MVRTSRLAARLLASADTKQLEKGLYPIYIISSPGAGLLVHYSGSHLQFAW
jgi:hypothetical protein